MIADNSCGQYETNHEHDMNSEFEYIMLSRLANSLNNINMKHSPKKLLILLDMNGTIIYRSAIPVPISNRKPDFEFNHKKYYIRENVFCLFNWLADAVDYIDFALYTSMRRQNAVPCLSYLFKYDSTVKKKIYIYDQPFNKKDYDGDKPWSMMRDLPRIWSLKGSPGYGYNDCNTIMIDDSFHKMREYPFNVLLIPEYNEQSIQTGYDNNLLKLIDCLSYIRNVWR
jgi:NLI interacting factor-like phosphatase